MAVIDTTNAYGASAGIFGRLFPNTIGAIAAWNDARATRAALAKLSDRELDDIGLCRGDIDMVVNAR